jgi:hypothetical protein
MGVPFRRGDPSAVIRLGVVGAPEEWLATLRATLTPTPDLVSVPDLSSIADEEPETEWDVALAFLSARSLRSLTDVLTLHDRVGFPEIVAITEHANDTAAAALRDFGVDRVVLKDDAIPWLSQALESLGSIARAKRLLRRSRSAIRETPRVDPFEGPSFLPLAVAEARFREAYLRALMAQTGSRALAAKGAGIPYRTLCYMLERYGIRDRARRPRLERA